MRKLILTLSVIVSAIAMANAQCNPVIAEDTSQFWTDGHVNALALKGSTLYMGGTFRHVGQYTGHFAVIDTASGRPLYRATWPKVNGTVYKAISDGAGGWIIGGSFTMAGDSARTNLAQINAAGQVTAFNPGANSSVRAMLLVGNDLYLGGDFTTIAGGGRTRLAKMSFPAGVLSSWVCTANGTVNDIARYNDRLYVAGAFTTIGGQSRKYLASMDTATGAVATWNAGITSTALVPCVNTIAFNNGKVYVGGLFNAIGGQPRSMAGAVDTGTAIATSWNPSMNNGVNKLLFAGGKVYAAGQFINVGGQMRKGLVVVDSFYGLPDSFDPGLHLSGAYFNELAVSNNMLVAGGAFYPDAAAMSGYTFVNYLLFIDIATGSISYNKCVTDNDVYTVNISNGKLYAGGLLTAAGIKERPATAAIDLVADTITQYNFPAGDEVLGLTAGPSKIYVCGKFMNLYNYTPSYLAFYLTATDPVTGQWDTGFNAHIEYPTTVKKVIYDAGNLYISGFISGIDGHTRDGIAKLNATTGALDLAWDPADFFTNSIDAIAVDANNVYIGGNFATVGYQPRRHLGAVNKTNGHATAWNPSPTHPVTALSLNNGKLLVGGYFDTIGTRGITSLAKLDVATGIADAWMPNPSMYGAVKTITPYYNTEFIAGQFDNIGATTVNGLGSVNVNTNIPSSWNPHPGYDSVYDMAVYGDRLFVAGGFSSISGQNKYPYFISYRIQQQPDTVRLNGPSAVCAGSTAHFTAANGIAATQYHWAVNGVAAGTTADTFAFVPAAGDVVTVSGIPPAGGCYTADTAMSNAISIATTAVAVPAVSVSGPSVVCYGSTVTYTSTTSVTGASHIWRVNGAGVGTAASYSYIPANGDVINCKITVPANTCYFPDTAVSNNITITDGPPVEPVISISALSTVALGVTVTVTASVASAGSGYMVKWYKNGVVATITTGNTYSYVKGVGADIIKATVMPAATAGCYDTMMSNTVYIYQAVGITDPNAGTAISAYPNPFDGLITMSGLSAGDKVHVLSTDGKLVKEIGYQHPAAEEVIDMKGLAQGLYIVQVYGAGGNVRTRLSIVKQ